MPGKVVGARYRNRQGGPARGHPQQGGLAPSSGLGRLRSPWCCPTPHTQTRRRRRRRRGARQPAPLLSQVRRRSICSTHGFQQNSRAGPPRQAHRRRRRPTEPVVPTPWSRPTPRLSRPRVHAVPLPGQQTWIIGIVKHHWQPGERGSAASTWCLSVCVFFFEY